MKIELNCGSLIKEEAFFKRLTNPKIFSLVKNPSNELVIECLKKNPDILQYVNNPNEEMCLTSIKINPLCIQFVKKQTSLICLEAIKKAKRIYNRDTSNYKNKFIYQYVFSLIKIVEALDVDDCEKKLQNKIMLEDLINEN